MRKIKVLVLVFALIASVSLFSGCANKILYGTWQLQETIDAETNESEAPMFANMMVFTINKDGTVVFLDKVFGTYEMDRNEFVFTYTLDEESEEEPEVVSGAWELIGTDLYIYPDDTPAIYHLAAVSTSNEE